MDGSLMCARYAFMPNRLKYCGPDRNRNLFEYVANDISDQGLADILSEFQGAYPYLTFIAHANGLSDPLDARVVGAYWLGNKLLGTVTPKQFADFTRDRFASYLSPAQTASLLEKIGRGGKPHHNFHVYHVFSATGGMAKSLEVTLPTINNCRISWGKVLRIIDSSTLEVKSDRVIFDELGRFRLEPITKEVRYQLEDRSFVPPPYLGMYVSIHWGWVCEVLGNVQLEAIKRYDRKLLEIPLTEWSL